MNSIFIEAREWFDKTGGNSYFSARISVDGKVVGYLPLQYGYESQYLTNAAHWLHLAGYITLDEKMRSLHRLKDRGVDFYAVKYSTTKAEAKRFGLDWREVAA